MKYVKCMFFTLAILFFGYVICGQSILPDDDIDHRSVCYEYSEDMWAYSSDGTQFMLDKPGVYEDMNIIETVLPREMDKQITSFCFRGNDASFYVDGQLRYEYSTEKTRWFGNESQESYVLVPISADDAGKTLRIELEKSETILFQIYMGTELGIWMHILRKYLGELIVAAITLIMGCLSIIISVLYGRYKHSKFYIGYLGFGVSLAAVWLIANSVYRQVIFSNVSVASDFPFLMVMLIPFPFLIYMDIIQEKRYTHIYLTASLLLFIIDVVSCVLYVLGIRDIGDSFVFVALACAGCIVTVILSFVSDMKKGKISSYRFVAFGLFGAFSAAIIQLFAYFHRTGIFSGSYLALGLILLLVGASIHTVHNVFSIEKDKTAAILASEAKGKFLANMSHEIRTPITAVLGMDEMILRESKEPSIRDYAMDIQNAGKNLLSLINDILDISKIESGKMEIIPAEYDVSSMMNDTMNMIYHKAKSKDLYATINIDEELPSRLIGDDIRIRQVLINILNNAVKYTNEGGVTLEVTGDKLADNRIILHFKVRDTGIGIKEEDLPKLYAQFERIEENRNRNIEGTGLGMSITLQLLELMNSKLNVESVYGEGSCFFFDLEQEIVDNTAIGNLSERIKRQEEEYDYENTFSATTSSILVVDDNSVNRKVVRNLLKDIGMHIDEADSGEKCLDMVCEKEYDIIFLDHMMPGLDGIETLQRFPGLDGNLNKKTPVIALTANAVTGAKEMYLNAGFDGFLTKPVIYSKLEATILQFLPGDKIFSAIPRDTDKAIESDDCADMKQKLIEDIPELNLDYAMLINENVDTLFEILTSFAHMMESDAKELDKYKKELPDDEALKQYRVKVHSMKASANLVGLLNLSGMARMLELAAIDSNVSTINKVHDVFLNEWERNRVIIKALLSEYNGNNEEKLEEKIQVNKELLLEQLNMLQKAVEEVDIDRADEIVELLKDFDYPDELQEVMDKIFDAVVSLDDSEIARLIEGIMIT